MSHETAHQVDSDDVERIVESELVFQGDRPRTDRAGNQTQKDRTHRCDVGTRRSDRHQARDDARRRAQRGRLLVANLLHDEPRQTGGARRQQRVRRCDCGGVVGCVRRSSVEAEPSEPQQAGTEHDHRQVVGAHRRLRPSEAPAQDDADRKGCRTSIDVNGGTTGEVDNSGITDAQLANPASAPHPVGHGEVDEGCPDGGEDDPRAELHPIREGRRR